MYIVFYKEASGVVDEDVSFNHFALGFNWPFTYSNSTYSEDKFNEINTFYGARGTFPLTVRIYVRVEQVQSV